MTDQLNTHHYIVPDKIYNRTFISLITLTVLTVITSRVDLGLFNTPLALSIAILKASCVGLFFMGLKWEKGINSILVGSSVICIGLFFALTFADISFRGDLSKEEEKPFKIKPIENIHTQESH